MDLPAMSKHTFTRSDVAIMLERGILASDERVELIHGELIDMSPVNPPHQISVRKLLYYFQQNLSANEYILDVQNTLTLNEKQLPQPDIVVAKFRQELLTKDVIIGEDVSLLIEVSDTTYSYDRNAKFELYASYNIPEYWIVHLSKREIEVHRQPEGSQFLESLIYRKPFKTKFGTVISPEDIFPEIR